MAEQRSSDIPYMESDVLVVGASAGLVGAIKAAELGAKVICIDKLPPMDPEKIIPFAPAHLPGGWGNCTAKSAGLWYYMSVVAPDSPAIAHGAGRASSDDNDLALGYHERDRTIERYKRMSRGRTDPELARTLFERSKADAKWLRENIGLLQAKTTETIAGKTVAGRQILPHLYAIAEQRGVKLLFEHNALELLSDDQGRVTGIRAMTPGGLKDFRAKATILATGSFEGDQAMKLQFLGPEKAYMMLTGCPTNTGDGLKMAAKMDAKWVNMTATHIRTTDAVVFSLGPSRGLPSIYTRSLYVNRKANRFVDENRAGDDIANSMAHQPDQIAYLIFDDRIKNRHIREYDNYISKAIQDAYRPTTEKELVIKAASIEELASKVGLSPTALKRTVDEFNAAVKDGKAAGIPFPKPQRAEKIEHPPFYSHAVTCALNHPLGGLEINTQAQVVNNENKVIPGLFAAGALVNVHFGGMAEVNDAPTYLSSYILFAGLGYSFTTSCLAAESAVAEIMPI